MKTSFEDRLVEALRGAADSESTGDILTIYYGGGYDPEKEENYLKRALTILRHNGYDGNVIPEPVAIKTTSTVTDVDEFETEYFTEPSSAQLANNDFYNYKQYKMDKPLPYNLHYRLSDFEILVDRTEED